MVLPLWEAYSATDRRPHKAIDSAIALALLPSGAARAARAAGAAADAAGAAGVAQWRWMHAAFLAAISPKWDPLWNTSTVRGVAWEIFDTLDFFAMPILADALQDASCDDDEMLLRLRNPDSLFTRADCCLWQPLGIGQHE